MMKGLYFVNDSGDVNEEETIGTVNRNAEFSFSYINLLAVSTIVCTLGLLTNTPAVVIGGMLISPLMWPLLRISLGVTYGRKSFIIQALWLLAFSMLIGILFAFGITFLSPLKTLNQEILSRTNPTIMDLFVALASGVIAALAVVQKKISASFAGVAIATSLMPPLCVIGIGLALSDMQVFGGSLLLFLSNIVSILFVSILVFVWMGLKTNKNAETLKKGMAFIGVALILTSLPLLWLLRDYTFRTSVYTKAALVIDQEIRNISVDAVVENISTKMQKMDVLVEADILLPADAEINDQQEQQLAAALETALERKVVLKLRSQRLIAVQSTSDKELSALRNAIRQEFVNSIENQSQNLGISTLTVQHLESNNWVVEAILSADPNTIVLEADRERLEKEISDKLDIELSLDLDIVTRLKLKSQPEIVRDKIRQEVEKMMAEKYPSLLVTSVKVASNSATIEVQSGDNNRIRNDGLLDIQQILKDKFQQEYQIMMEVVRVERVETD